MAVAHGEGVTSPVRSEQQAANDRALLIAFLTVRSLQLIIGSVCMATGWRAYRRPRLALATLVASILESTWVAVRSWPRRAYSEPLPAWVETGFGLGGLWAISAATYPDDRTTFLNWMCPLTFGTVAGVAMSTDSRVRISSPLVLAGAYVATVRESMRAGGSQLATAAANTVCYGSFYLAADRFARRLRRDAESLDKSRAETIVEQERLATERERNRQHRLLHDSALQILEAVARRDVDADVLSRQARREAAALRRAISGNPVLPSGLVVGLELLADEFRDRGLRVELVAAEVRGDPGRNVATALCDAAREALTNVTKHAGVSRAVVRAVTEDDGVKVTVRDHGCGFDLPALSTGFGIANSISRRLADVGGRAQLWSAPGRGTLVELWAPA